MPGWTGASPFCPYLKPLFKKMGGMLSQFCSPNKYRTLHPALERKTVEAIKRRAASRRRSFKSMNSIILRFPQLKEELRTIRSIFEKYDEDSNGTIDHGELRKCVQELQLHLPDKDIDELYYSCDIDGDDRIQFNEFVVLLCLVFLLGTPASTLNETSMPGLPQLEATFDTIIEAFLFLDHNCDGQVNQKDVIRALHKGSSREKFPGYITSTRFEEMDHQRSGKVSFKEFLSTFINWVGLEADEEIEIT